MILPRTMPAGRLFLSWDVDEAADRAELQLCWRTRRRHLATLWVNPDRRVTWHTWDLMGVGGQNASEADLASGIEAVLGALLFQAWIPDLKASEWRGALEVLADMTADWRRARNLGTLRWSYA